MTLARSVLLTIAMTGSLAGPLRAQDNSSAMVASGHKFAEAVCGACHVVQKEGNIPILDPPGPSFVALAQRPDLTEQSLRDFLGSNHRGMGPANAMPNPRLADYEIDEVVAYVLSLKVER